MAYPSPMYVLLRNQQYLTVENAQTESLDIETDYYDSETYRNTLPAGYIGRAWASSITIPFASPASPETKDDNVNLVAPHPLQKSRTMIRWLNGADVVGECWADQFIGISSAVPRFVT